MEGKLVILAAVIALCSCEIFFEDTFEDGEAWEQRWVQSTDKPTGERGQFKLSAGKFHGDAEKDKGIKTSEDARFYQLSAKIEKPFSNEGKKLVLQYTVKHEQNIDCGGGYIKLFPANIDPVKMNGDTPYFIMFGPDICGPGTKKVHVIFTYKEKNHLVKKDIRCKDDEYTHLYTLIVNSDNSYEVKIDGEKADSGKFEDDFDFLAPKMIPDPAASKPEDWVDEAKVADPTSVKPEDWDKEPELVADPEAKKPEDWDDEEDGEWEAAQINNPKFKGEFKAKMIDNPLYKGEWVHPEIENPEYQKDDEIYKFSDIGHIGFEIWQVKSGTIYDNILVTDSEEEAAAHAKKYFEETKGPEKKMKESIDAVEQKKEEEEREKNKEDAPKDDKDAPAADDDEEEKEDEDDDEQDEGKPETDAPDADASEAKADTTTEDKVEDEVEGEAKKDEL